MIDYSERLRHAMGCADASVRDLATALGVSYQAVFRVLDGSTKALTADNNARAARFLKVNPTWLALGEGPMDESGPDSDLHSTPRGKRAYPVISMIQAAALKEVTDFYSAADGFDVEVGEDGWSKGTFALELEGNSMEPMFREGDRVLIDPSLSARPGDFVVAKNNGYGATFKKYRARGMSPEGQTVFELVPLNPDYETLRSDAQPLEIIGVMVEHRRQYRRPNLNNN